MHEKRVSTVSMQFKSSMRLEAAFLRLESIAVDAGKLCGTVPVA